ncbi:hypothetical protein BGZ98_003842 [Dissophora globulifera]|nr:hypothetical protein BGZ98_003842 [Dissophora globulifera]
MTTPFSQYDKVDVYVVDDVNNTRAFLLQSTVDLNVGMMATRLQAALFPEDLPINRSCHVVLTGVGNTLDGKHQTLNSSSFQLIRTKQTINGTLIPIPTAASTTLLTTTNITPINAPAATTSAAPAGGAAPPPPISSASDTSDSLSPLVIGLISAGCLTLIIAIVAIGLLFRARRRYKGNTGDFKSLYDHPSSPTDDACKNPIFKSEAGHEMTGSDLYGGPDLCGPMPIGRTSSNTARSSEPMIKGHGRQAPSSPAPAAPLVEQKSSTLNQDATLPTGSAAAGEAGTEMTREKVVPRSVLSADDAQLIAERFRKSMRRPQWEDDTDEEENEARRAANDLLRRELSEQGLDVHRGVQRRVTIQDRTHRSSLKPPISQSKSIPEP